MTMKLDITSTVPTLKEIERVLEWTCKRVNDDTAIKLVPNISSVNANCVGWFRANAWKTRKGVKLAEIGIPPEKLGREPVDIVATLLHETAHAWNSSKGIEDSASNQRHNKHFKEKAEALGLIVAPVTDYIGFGHTSLSPALRKQIKSELKPTKRKFNISKIANARKKSTAKPRRVPWGCDENCQGNIYVSSNQTDYVGHCGRCKQQYERKN